MRPVPATVRQALVVIVILLLVAAAILMQRKGDPTKEKVIAVESGEFPRAPPAPPLSTVSPAIDAAGDRAPAPPQDARVSEGPVHPHPITPDHERLFAENKLFAAISAAMDRRDTMTMRRLLEEYEDDYPEDAQLLQRGFNVIADCIDHPGPASTAAAQAYFSANKASILRRHVRRHCFEPIAP
jgi:hypothetical protein